MPETVEQTGFHPRSDRGNLTQDALQGSRWFRSILPLLVFTVAVISAAYLLYYRLPVNNSMPLTIVFSTVLSIFLSLLPAMICVVQNITKKRQQNRLSSLEGFPVSKTMHFQVAISAVQAMKIGGVDADYGAPLFVYFFLLFFGFIAIFIGYTFISLFNNPTVLLGGLMRLDDPNYAIYQMNTFVIVSMAFLASYIYSLGRLLDRVNNNDLYPISLYYYSARVVIACSVAAVMWHTSRAFFHTNPPILILLGFTIGFAPDLFILAFTRRAFQTIKMWGSRDDPPSGARPLSLPLMMIDDLTRDKIERLNELGIDNAQVLSRQNPFLLLPRLPYDLGLIVDWIAQAQLYVLVREVKFQALREMLIRDPFDLYIRLKNSDEQTEIAKVLGVSNSATVALITQLDHDQSFTRLGQVREAMLVNVDGISRKF